jgi:hypothetical protein
MIAKAAGLRPVDEDDASRPAQRHARASRCIAWRRYADRRPPGLSRVQSLLHDTGAGGHTSPVSRRR